MRRKKIDADTIETHLSNILRRLWMLENPPRFSRGDKVDFYFTFLADKKTGVVADVEFCDSEYMGQCWLYNIWVESDNKLETFPDYSYFYRAGGSAENWHIEKTNG